MKTLVAACLILTLSGCSTLTPKQTVVLPDGREYRAEVMDDTLVQITNPDGTQILIDRKGRASPLENVVTLYTTATMRNLSDKD